MTLSSTVFREGGWQVEEGLGVTSSLSCRENRRSVLLVGGVGRPDCRHQISLDQVLAGVVPRRIAKMPGTKTRGFPNHSHADTPTVCAFDALCLRTGVFAGLIQCGWAVGSSLGPFLTDM